MNYREASGIFPYTGKIGDKPGYLVDYHSRGEESDKVQSQEILRARDLKDKYFTSKEKDELEIVLNENDPVPRRCPQ